MRKVTLLSRFSRICVTRDTCFCQNQADIFQCESGHPVCSDCHPKMKNKCHTWEKPFIATRLLPLEHISEQIYRPCDAHGCSVMLTTAQRKNHAFQCEWRE